MKDIGTLGEKLVGRWLELQNYKLLQQNWRCRWGEIDIIAQNRIDKIVAFVEVKTRSSNNWDAGGLLAINCAKQEKIIKTASLFLAKYPQLSEFPCRFDVALVSYKSTPRRQGANSTLEDITQLAMGEAVTIEQYQLAMESYLPSAFELS